ncbi:putative transporter [Neonectria ditissima]|uniref:Putative transporter n=1 Tax=Neonectria ditissima TaxID=78410 RepID=A0A0P7BQN7_9HYPO|nr:putative transporter [Neonectria ditissima]
MAHNAQNSSTETTPKGRSSTGTATMNQDEPADVEDLEAGGLPTRDTERALDDPNLVSWENPQDPVNPMNWTTKQKMVVTVTMSAFTFISPVSSSMVAPALTKLGQDLGMKKEMEVEMALSIFVLGYAIGPLFFGPVSDVFGRSYVLQFSNLFYLIWNLSCGFARNRAEFFVFRFLAGIGGSAPLAIGAGLVSDCWSPEERGKAVGIYSLGPMLGPVVGPVAAGFIAERTTWRWVFWSTSIAAGFIQIAGLIWMRETYAPVLLSRKRERLVKETGNEKLHTGPDSTKSLSKALSSALLRLSRMLATQPIVQAIALYMAYLFGVTYLITVTFPVVWTEVYGESLGISGLNFISLAVGSIFGAVVSIRFVDRIYRRLKENNGGVGRPEFRVPSMFVGSILVPVGLLWYGWSVQGRVHWIMPNIGIVIFVAGTLVCLQGMQGYVIDSYSRYAASGLAAAVVLRSLAGFAFPLFAPYLYERLDYGWGTSVLALVSIAIGIPAPFMFYFFGAKLRGMSKYAAG